MQQWQKKKKKEKEKYGRSFVFRSADSECRKNLEEEEEGIKVKVCTYRKKRN